MEAFYKTLLDIFISSFVFGILLAVAAYIFMHFTSHFKAQIRYNVLVLMLFVFVAIILFFGISHLSTAYQGINSNKYILLPDLAHNTENLSSQPIQISKVFLFLENLYVRMYDFALEITLVWCLIFCYKMIKLFCGVRNIKRLIIKNKIELNGDWNQKILQFCDKVGIKKKIKVYLSSTISSPVVLGFFRPIVLVPIQLTTGLSQDQLEVVIYHELMHIKRYDSIVNLIQNFLEAIFFFNLPFIWFSNLIKNEREKCCDDAVLEITHNKKDYISALYYCAAIDIENPALSLGFSGNREVLLERVERILLEDQNDISKVNFTKFHLFGVFLFVLLIGAFSQLKIRNTFNFLPETSINETEKSSKDKDYYTITGITANVMSEKEGEKIVSTLNVMIDQMIDEELIITNDKDLSFMLDDNQLVINGKTQPSHIFDKYQSKYIKKSDWRICYNFKVKK
ncbi:BlaR1 peptidase M56 [Flavobacterium chryseum]|uniref:M56 family metallopeptidase n=1 Tax=Flavobacterium sp. P3160 TaxID=2512113 RepID=UPI00105F6DFF|nr:M56 family metallopeptidase [Flavobacterium sp. P3160]TDO73423.1 BlaR1 peptidase M56 [Flavobacterium sp. P3160]